MAKRRKPAGRPPEIQRAIAATSPRRTPPKRQPQKPASTGINRIWLYVGAAAAVLAGLAVLAFLFRGNLGFGGPSPTPLATRGGGPFEPPTATPLASPPAEPAGDGTTVTIETSLGNIVMEVYNQSAPVAAENFTNLVDAGYYNTLVFHRIIPDFVIQGGDPEGTGGGGPGYTIQDEPVVGDYTRGIVAMARTSAPNSQGSQFFICLADLTQRLDKAGGYVIFGKVVSGMELADQIAAGPSSGGQEGTALEPVKMERVTVQRP
jgi:cyclophilin family peptidyl-prolyl cis-trans isomerase